MRPPCGVYSPTLPLSLTPSRVGDSPVRQPASCVRQHGAFCDLPSHAPPHCFSGATMRSDLMKAIKRSVPLEPWLLLAQLRAVLEIFPWSRGLSPVAHPLPLVCSSAHALGECCSRFARVRHSGGNPGANRESNLPQMQPGSGGICMGVDCINHRFAPGLPPGWPHCFRGATIGSDLMDSITQSVPLEPWLLLAQLRSVVELPPWSHGLDPLYRGA